MTTFTIWDAIRAHRDQDTITYAESKDLWERLYRRPGIQYHPPWKVLERFNEILDRRTNLNHGDWFLCEHYGLPFPQDQARYTSVGDHGPYSDVCVEDDLESADLCWAEGTRSEGNELLCRQQDCRETDSGDWITERLYEYEYRYCDSCGGLFHENDVYYRETRDAQYCEHCDPGEDEDDEESDDGRALYSYSTKIERVKYVYLRHGIRYFGLEVEMEFPGQDRSETCEWALENVDDLSSLAIFKEDGSLSHGAELVTVPQTLDYWRGDNPLKDLCGNTHWRRIAKSHNTTTCGLHIHVSRSTVPEPVIAKLIVLMNDDSMRDLVTLIARRAPTTAYCLAQKKKWLSDINYDWQRTVDNLGPRDAKNHLIKYVRPMRNISKVQIGQHGRYTPVNLTSNTLEFRIFRGTLKWETILASIEFCDAVISFCTQYGAGAMNAKRFREWLATSITRKTYPALRDYLVSRKVFAAPKVKPVQVEIPSTVTSSHVADSGNVDPDALPEASEVAYYVAEYTSPICIYLVMGATDWVRIMPYTPDRRPVRITPTLRESYSTGDRLVTVAAVRYAHEVPEGSMYQVWYPESNCWSSPFVRPSIAI